MIPNAKFQKTCLSVEVPIYLPVAFDVYPSLQMKYLAVVYDLLCQGKPHNSEKSYASHKKKCHDNLSLLMTKTAMRYSQYSTPVAIVFGFFNQM